ncbi:MAG: ankyrin repeat domain-containing protein, partial [Burkholderiales bacterium]
MLAVLVCLSTSTLAAASTYDDMLHAIEIDDQRTVAGLLKRGVDVDSVNPKGESLLMLAVRSGKPSVVKTILAAKPKINARNAYGETALMLAAISGRTELVRILLESGAEVNHSGWTPLMYAATNNHVDIARLLLTRGAQVNATAQNGTSALMMAARGGHLPMVLLLL